jgi:prolyl-tRNA synthetase
MTMRARLDEYQRAVRVAAIDRREQHSHRDVKDYGQLKELVEADAGFVFGGWCGSPECEQKVKEETRATIRCLPFEEFQSPTRPTKCLVCGGSADQEAVWARAY